MVIVEEEVEREEREMEKEVRRWRNGERWRRMTADSRREGGVAML